MAPSVLVDGAAVGAERVTRVVFALAVEVARSEAEGAAQPRGAVLAAVECGDVASGAAALQPHEPSAAAGLSALEAVAAVFLPVKAVAAAAAVAVAAGGGAAASLIVPGSQALPLAASAALV